MPFFRSMPGLAVAILALSGALLCACGASPPPRLRISDFAWLAGTWVGSGPDDLTIEEQWSEPRNGSMTGFHIARIGDDVRIRGELRLIGGERGVVLLGSPEGRLPNNYPLVESGDRLAAFANPNAEPPQFCRFERRGDELLVRFESVDPLGTRRTVDVRLKRVGPPPP